MNKAPDNQEAVDIECEIRARSELAVMIYDGTKTVWIPRSEIICAQTDDGQIGQYVRTTLTIPEWLATEKGLQQASQDVDTLDLFGGAE